MWFDPAATPERFFEDFLKEIRDDLNESVSERDAIEMLAQHIITRPVFDALFEGHAFVDRNPVSVAMQEVLGVIDETQIRTGSGEAGRFLCLGTPPGRRDYRASSTTEADR